MVLLKFNVITSYYNIIGNAKLLGEEGIKYFSLSILHYPSNQQLATIKM